MRALFGRNTDYGVWDRAGVILSALCLLHCLSMPMIVLSLPILARYYLANPIFHLVLALMIVPVGAYSFYKGYKHHHKVRPIMFGLPGMLLVSLTPYLVHVQGLSIPEQVSMIFGSALLITAHLINRRSCHKCHHH